MHHLKKNVCDTITLCIKDSSNKRTRRSIKYNINNNYA